ncbi:MAG: LemA family protein [Candidatus Pacearchaeota archaeon]
MIWPIIVLIVLAILIVLAFIIYYNRFVTLENRIENSLSQIDVQLKKRIDLVPNLINAVKGYMKHERGIMTEVTRARQAILKSPDFEGRVKAGAELERFIGKLFAVAENYPQLKANENFLQLQQELAVIEDKIAYARQHYNDSVLSFNNIIKRFPGNIFASIYNKSPKKYLEIPQEERSIPKVEF